MSFLCCGIKYSKSDPETYWCIDTYINKTVLKKFVENKRVVKEVIEVLTCKKNGCLKLQIKRYDRNKKIVECQDLKGKEAIKYLTDTEKIRIKQPLICPMQNVPSKTKNDFRYGKVIDGTTQRVRYLNEQGWAEDRKIKAECRIYKNGAGMGETVL